MPQELLPEWAVVHSYHVFWEMVGYSLKTAEFPVSGVFIADMPSRLDIKLGPLFFGGKIYCNGVVFPNVDRITPLYQEEVYRLFDRFTGIRKRLVAGAYVLQAADPPSDSTSRRLYAIRYRREKRRRHGVRVSPCAPSREGEASPRNAPGPGGATPRFFQKQRFFIIIYYSFGNIFRI
jgi:hypothetical protein